MNSNPRVVMLTGASGNLGRAVAQAFVDLGDTLVLLGHSRAGLAKAFGDESPQQSFITADLRDAAAVDAAVAQALQQHGRIDVLCHLAGGFHMGEPVHDTPAEAWNQMFELNARSLLHVSHAVVPAMQRQRRGAIVTVGANSAQHGAAQMGAYIAAKSALMRLTESMSAELREQGINVNCVMPSIIDTPENRTAMPKADASRWVAPQDLAAVIVFLASEAARAVHGAAVPVVGLS